MISADFYGEAAWSLLREGAFGQARALCREGLRSHPEDACLWQAYGLAAWELGDVEPARWALETASCLRPLKPISQCVLGQVYLRTNHIESARTIFAFLAEGDHCPLPLLPRVAQGLGQLGEFEQALRVCRKLAALRPTYHPAHFGIAYYLGCLHRPAEESLPHLRKAYELAPSALAYQIALAGLLVRLGRMPQAVEVFSDLDPGTVCCPDCVLRLLSLVELSGREDLIRAWRQRLQQFLA